MRGGRRGRCVWYEEGKEGRQEGCLEGDGREEGIDDLSTRDGRRT